MIPRVVVTGARDGVREEHDGFDLDIAELMADCGMPLHELAREYEVDPAAPARLLALARRPAASTARGPCEVCGAARSAPKGGV